MAFEHLGTLVDAQRSRRATPKHAMASRLEKRTSDVRNEKAAENAWRKAVIARDGRVCRICKRKVIQQLALAPNRLEVHHIAGRADRIVRWDVRNGILLCAECHGRVTRHRVHILQAAKFLFRVNGLAKSYIDATHLLQFKEVR